jgi:hypothetical protein
MCEQYDSGIEHPNQSWYLRATADQMSDADKAALTERYTGIPAGRFDVDGLFEALDRVTQQIHLYRDTHERANRARIGINPPTADSDNGPSQLWIEYDGLTGRAEKVGHFVSWFSRVSHAAYVRQENLPNRDKFVHVSLEIGGKRQFGDWDATQRVDDMAKSIPRQLLEVEPVLQHMTVFGESTSQRVDHPKVKYVDDAPKSYLISPHWQSGAAKENDDPDNLRFDYLKVRRRRPFADVFIEDQSDTVLFKESWGLIPMVMVHPQIRAEITKDIQSAFLQAYEKFREERRQDPDAQERPVKIQDTPGARLAGAIFETAIKSGSGETKDIVPVSAHYVQAVGEKYSLHRDAAA